MRARRGFTLLEVLVAVSVLAMISMLLYSAFAGLHNSKDGITRISDRYHEGSSALRRIAHELQGAYVSTHAPIDLNTRVVYTAFVGSEGAPADRLDFNAFVHRRLDRNAHESDQAELSYLGSPDPNQDGVVDLARRINPRLDSLPKEGGRVQVLATDIELFDLKYLDPQTGEWSEVWDTTQALEQFNRLPLQVRVVLELNGGRRRSTGPGQDTISFMTKVMLPMQQALNFAFHE